VAGEPAAGQLRLPLPGHSNMLLVFFLERETCY
jgi:hypothetical protein